MRSTGATVFVTLTGLLIGCGTKENPPPTPGTPAPRTEQPPTGATPPKVPPSPPAQPPTGTAPAEKLPDVTMAEIEAFEKLDVSLRPSSDGGGSINFESNHVTEAGVLKPAVLEALKRTPSVTELSFQQARAFSDAGLADLKDLNHLRKLRIHGTKVTDEGMRHLKGMAKLEELMLSDTRVTDKGLSNLKGLKNLKEIDLGTLYGQADITDAGLAELSLGNLNRLQINGTKITDAGLALLKDSKNLSVLWADKTDITDKGLEHLKPLTKLGWLKLERTKVTDAGLVHLEGLTQLFALELAGTKVTKPAAEKFQAKVPKCRIEGPEWKLPAK